MTHSTLPDRLFAHVARAGLQQAPECHKDYQGRLPLLDCYLVPSANKDYNSPPQGPLLCLLGLGPWLANAVIPLQVRHPVINLTGMQLLSIGRSQVVP